MPTDFYGNGCSVNALPYVNNCNFDTAGEMLKWLYGPLNPKNAGVLGGSYVNFSQAAFWGNFNPTVHGMASSGYAYVPASCAAGQACKLHVALHGRGQNAATVGGSFYQNAGYNRWADTNNMIVMYPQASPTASNPDACWDWWGYDDVNFPGKSGGQMVAIKTMIDRVVSGDDSAPYTSATGTTATTPMCITAAPTSAATGRRMRLIQTSILGFIRPWLIRMCGGRRLGTMRMPVARDGCGEQVGRASASGTDSAKMSETHGGPRRSLLWHVLRGRSSPA